MDIEIPEKKAMNLLVHYEGANNYILDIKDKSNSKYYKLGRSQADYILKYHNDVPKIARKWVDIDIYYGEQLQEQKILPLRPNKIWVEKILVEKDKSFHIWGKIIESEKLYAFWVPKSQLIPNAKEELEIEYSSFSHRPPLSNTKKKQ